MVTIEITQDFIDQRDARAEIYNPGKRTIERLKRDIEAEVYEWYMTTVTEEWLDEPDDWKIDGYIISPDGNLAVDVKFVDKWYNIAPKKLYYILKQRDVLDGFVFMEWVERPDRLLVAGDTVTVQGIGYIPYWELVDIIQPSKFNGFYADVRRYLK